MLGATELESSFAEEDVGMLVDTKVTISQECTLVASKANSILVCQSKNMICSLLVSGKAIPGLFWDSQYKTGSHRLIAMKMIKELEHLSHEKSLRELVLSAWRRLKAELIDLYIKT